MAIGGVKAYVREIGGDSKLSRATCQARGEKVTKLSHVTPAVGVFFLDGGWRGAFRIIVFVAAAVTTAVIGAIRFAALVGPRR